MRKARQLHFSTSDDWPEGQISYPKHVARLYQVHGTEWHSGKIASAYRLYGSYTCSELGTGVRVPGTLERSPELEDSLFWIYKSHQRVEQQVALTLGVLERRLAHVESLRAQIESSFRTLLDQIISFTRGIFPAISDLARELRYRCFDQPLFENVRGQVYAQAEEHFAHLATHPQADDRQERVRALFECPQPLVRFAGRFATADLAMRQLMLEVITRRYYRVQTLLDLGSHEVNGQPCVSTEYEEEGKRVRLFTTQAELPRLRESAQAISPLIEQVPADQDVVIDFYIWHPSDGDATQTEVCSMLNQTCFPRAIRHIVLIIAGPGHGDGMGAVRHFTFRLGERGYEEDKLYGGLHPMMAKRLHLQRFCNFQLERLPSVEDVYLFHAVAHEISKRANLAVKRARNCVDDVQFYAEDAGRAVPSYLFEMLEAVIDAGATVVNIPDTTGYTVPEQYGELIRRIRENVPNIARATISVHCHDDLGLALANSLAGIRRAAGGEDDQRNWRKGRQRRAGRNCYGSYPHTRPTTTE